MAERTPNDPTRPPKGAAAADDKAAGDDAGKPAAAAPQPAAAPSITINAQYVKDLSFEAPATPAVFGLMQNQQPNIAVNIDVKAHAMQENVYEVVLHVKAECKVADTVAFVVELIYGGLFGINVPSEHLEPVLLIECPRLLFPYVRYIVSDVTRDGGFPPLLIGPVDFVSMYQRQRTAELPRTPAASPPSQP